MTCIVHVFHNYYPLIGGMERVVQGLAEAQAKLGYEIHVITSDFGAKEKDNQVLNGVNITRINVMRCYYPDLTLPKKTPFELFRKADVVHVHGHNSLFSLNMLKKASLMGVKTACYFMAVDVFRSHPNLFVRSLAPYYGKRNTKQALKFANLNLVKSMKDLEVLRQVYHVEPFFLPDALPRHYFTLERGNSFEIRKIFGITQEKFFLFIGRMHRLKGPQVLVEALKYVPADIALVFIGPDNGFLKESVALAVKFGVRDRIYFLGIVDEYSKICLLDSAIALVLPSITDYVEVYPGVISEAWAREKPVIASRIGGVPYRIRDYVNGLLVDPSNPKMLADAMLELNNNAKFAEELGKKGKNEVFSWDEIASKSIELYSHVLD